MLGPEFHPQQSKAVLPKHKTRVNLKAVALEAACGFSPQQIRISGPSNANSSVLKLQCFINGRAQFKGDERICQVKLYSQ